MHFWFDLFRSGIHRKLPEDPISGKRSGRGNINWNLLSPYLKRHWKKGVIGAIAILVATLLTFPIPMITRFLIDRVILEKHLEWLIWAILALAGAKGFSVIAGMVEQYVFKRFQLDVSVDLQENLLGHTLQLPKTFFDDKEVGYLMSRVVSDVQGLSWFFSQSVVYIFTNILRFIGGIVFLIVLEWRLALATIVILPLLIFAVQAFARRLRVLGHHSMEQTANVYSSIQETLSSIPLIKAFVSEKQESRRVIDEVKTSQRIALEATVVSSVANSVFSLVPDIAKGLVLLLGAYWVIQSDWTLGSLLAFQSYLGYVYGPALSLIGSNLELQNALVSLDRISALMNVIPENSGGKNVPVNHLKGKVQFSNVSFSYDQNANVLEDITFQVDPGEHIAIVGPSGVGKTTLISLLLRFYKPLSGEIYYDDIPASDYALDSLRQRIGYVSQSTLLMARSIRENLCYGNKEAEQMEIDVAVKTAGIYDFIMSLPQKYETLLGENGVNLSEGQKQRLAIARALIKDPDIVILDEPTSALDGLLERSLFEELPKQVCGKTLFIAAHRLSTIQQADRIMILKDKRLIGFGTHKELITNNEYYRSLHIDG